MNSGTAHERDEIESLLPWHATGKLERADARRVDAALARDQDLVRHLAAVRDEIAETIHIHEMLDVPSSRLSRRVFAVVDTEAPKVTKSSVGLGTRLARFIGGFQARTLAWAGAACLAVIVAQSGLLATMYFADQYGQVPGTDAYRSVGPRADLLVRFRSTASANDIVGFLARNNARLVDGPQEGRFRVRIANVTTSQELTEAMRRMQAETAIVDSVSGAR
jgi:hypothetical protein